MEFISEIKGVKFFEDYNSKSPEDSEKTLSFLDEPLIWIAGGENNDGNFSQIFYNYFDKIYLLCLIGENSNYIKSFALRESFSNIYIMDSLKEAIRFSYLSSEKGTTVLFSPASYCDKSLKEEFIKEVLELRRDEDAKNSFL